MLIRLASLIPVLVPFLAPIAQADIVGGEEVTRPQDPTRKSIAALYEPSRTGPGGALCTASLIGRDTAVTAAHCVDPNGPKPVMIFGDDVRSPLSSKRPVTAVSVHPKWKTRRGVGMDQGDIAIVKFGGGIPEGYQTIPMLNGDASLKRGESATLAGYGINDARTHSGAGILRKTRVKIDDARAGKTEMILDQSRGHGACHGDSGGPAYVRQNGKLVLAGVTNRSYPASAPDDCHHKVVYTKVGAYEPWIRKTQEQLDHARQNRPELAADTSMRSLHSRNRRYLGIGEKQLARYTRQTRARRPKPGRGRHIRHRMRG